MQRVPPLAVSPVPLLCELAPPHVVRRRCPFGPPIRRLQLPQQVEPFPDPPEHEKQLRQQHGQRRKRG